MPSISLEAVRYSENRTLQPGPLAERMTSAPKTRTREGDEDRCRPGHQNLLYASFLKLTLVSCHTILVLMKPSLRNVTVTLEERVARWARLEAAKRETSVSRLLGEILKQRMEQGNEYERAMRRALARKPLPKPGGPLLSREEVHERDRLR